MLKTITINQTKDLTDLDKIRDNEINKDSYKQFSNIGLIRFLIKFYWNNQNKKEVV